MALINCPECNAQISDAAISCPQCGAPLTKQTSAPDNNTPKCPETHLTKAIIVTVLCCWPLGIPAIVNAAGVSNAFLAGRYDIAEQKSKEAEKWCKYCIIAGVAFWALYIIFIAVCACIGAFA